MTDRPYYDEPDTPDAPAGEPTSAATFRARQGEERIAELEAEVARLTSERDEARDEIERLRWMVRR